MTLRLAALLGALVSSSMVVGPALANDPFVSGRQAPVFTNVADRAGVRPFRQPTVGDNLRRQIKRQILRGLQTSGDIDRAILRRLRTGVDAAFGPDPLTGGGTSVIQEGSTVVFATPRSETLRESNEPQVLRPPAKVIEVTQRQRQLGERRAANRALGDSFDPKRIRFYRPNEAYDERFPSFVYLNTPD